MERVEEEWGKGGKSRGGVEWNLLERENVHVLNDDVIREKVQGRKVQTEVVTRNT